MSALQDILKLKFFQFQGDDLDLEKAKIIWLSRLRWAAIALFVFFSVPSLFLQKFSRQGFFAYVVVITVLCVFNLITYLVYADTKNISRTHPLMTCFYLGFDLLVLSLLLYLSGGIYNPLMLLFLLNTSLGALLIKGKYAWPFLAICHLMLLFLQLDYYFEQPNSVDFQVKSFFVTSHILIFSFWLIMRSLGTHLEKHFTAENKSKIQLEKQDRLRAVGALAAGFSHEFASPLNAAKLRLDRAYRTLSKVETSEIKEDIVEAVNCIYECESVIHQMNSSQLDVREFKLKDVNFKNYIKDVTDSWLEEHQKAQLQIEISSPAKVRIPPLNLAQVILNLLDNAYEANPNGSITLSIYEKGQTLYMVVQDEGAGFSEKVLERQGEPFLTTKKNGTGLGLYVSGIFATSMGGKMSLENATPTRGAKVTIEWPILITEKNEVSI